MAMTNPSTTNTTTKFEALLMDNGRSNLEINQTLLFVSVPELFIMSISDSVLYWAEIIGHIGLSGTISVFGIVANIINIIVFIRQGLLSDSSTISLFVLSMTDLLSLVSLLWVDICFMLIYIQPSDLPFDPTDMLYVSGGRVHVMCVQMTSWLTVYIALERCVCVVFPFQVRRLFTPKRTAILLPSIVVIILFGGYLPYFLYEYLIWEKVPNSNRSILVLYRDPRGNIRVSRFLNALVTRIAALFLVLIFTQITAFRVNASRKWRQRATTPNVRIHKNKTVQKHQSESHVSNEKENESVSDSLKSPESNNNNNNKGNNNNMEMKNREKRLVKMISVISVIFIVCMLPHIIFIVMESLEPEIAPRRTYHNLFFFNYAISFFLEAVNSSINIFVYYNMSTKYRCEFRKFFRMEE